jgi:peptidoglycan/LPS O-acetylase OafA/YrhL
MKSANSNFESIFDKFGDSSYIISLTGPYAVDTFFWISGFFMAFFYISEVERASNYSTLDVLTHYLHRYLRLTPANFFALLFFWSMEKYLGNGPLFSHVAEKTQMIDCDKYMYSNILYLNNIIPDNKGNYCMLHTWSMGVDMQCFIFFTLVLLLYLKVSKLLGWLLIAASCCCGIVTSGIIAAKYDLLTGLPLAFKQEYVWYYYTKPYCRMAPYALGVGAGIILYSFRQQQQGKVFDRFANAIANAFDNVYFRCGMFFLGLCLINTFIFAQLDVYAHPGPDYEYQEWNEAQNSAFIAFEHFGFGLGVMLILMPMLLGHFRWIIAIMSYGPWNFFARISFCSYLVHASIINLAYLSEKTADEFNIFNTIRYVVFFFIFSNFCALPLVLVVELPIMNLEKLLIRPPQKFVEYMPLIQEDPDDKKPEKEDN